MQQYIEKLCAKSDIPFKLDNNNNKKRKLPALSIKIQPPHKIRRLNKKPDESESDNVCEFILFIFYFQYSIYIVLYISYVHHNLFRTHPMSTRHHHHQ